MPGNMGRTFCLQKRKRTGAADAAPVRFFLLLSLLRPIRRGERF
ncbi:hypothetical protein SRB521_00342 [Intestinimonas butyriciproducens]|nr:hypothetical protein SRB521_00342 [Intestinimonas butyriciproducens]